MTRLTKVVVAALLSFPLAAETLDSGQNEVLGFAGVVSGGGGATLGGGIQHALRSRWLFSGELAYITGHGDLFKGASSSGGLSVDANAHFLIPLRNAPEFTPYVLAGLGILHANSNTSAGFNIGGGARWALGRDWGLRPELKFLIADGSSTRFTIGIYKRF